MGTAYTLSLFDPVDTPCQGVDTRQLATIEQVESLLKLLEKARPGANPRFERLLTLLDRVHLGHGVEAGGSVDGLPIQAGSGSTQRFGPGADQAVLRVSLDLDTCDLPKVMPDLLFWCRELGLDTYDELQKIFLPWRSLPLPKEEGIAFARQSGWANSLRIWGSALELRQRLIDRLTHLLIEHGYHLKVEPGYDAVFERNIEDGFQRIAARIGGEHPAFTCKLDIEQGSKFYTDAMARAGHVLGNPDGLQLIINEQLSFFRSLNHPGWRRLPGHVVNLIWTEGWLDWMLDDLRALVLPVLEEGRTAAGLFRLYTSTTWTNRFPAAIGLSGNARVESMFPALVAAAMATSREFEVLFERFASQVRRHGETSALNKITRLAECLRPVSSGQPGVLP